MGINECVMCANFGDPRSGDRKLRHKNITTRFLASKFIYWPLTQKTTWRARLKFELNVGDYKWFMQTEFGGTRSCKQNATGRKWAENERF